MKAFLEHFAAIVGFFTVALFAMSWCHEYGYFWSIGTQFQAFLTTTDYLTNGVLWLPFGVLLLYNYVDWWRLKDEEPTKMDWSTRSTKVWAVIGAVLFLFFLLTVTWPIGLLFFGSAMIVVSIMWSWSWRRWVPKSQIEEPFGSLFEECYTAGTAASYRYVRIWFCRRKY